MRKPSTTALRRKVKLQDQHLTIGLDLGDRSSLYCVLNGAGEVALEAKIATHPEAMKETFSKMAPSRIALETGTHSPWVSRLHSELGHEAIVAHARNVPPHRVKPAQGRPTGRAGTGQVGENRSAFTLTDSTSQRSGTS